MKNILKVITVCTGGLIGAARRTVTAILARAVAEKDAEIASLKYKRDEVYTALRNEVQAQIARAERAEAELAEAKDHIAIATHPELGWAVSEEEHNKVVAERDQLLAEVERLSAPRSTLRSPADIKEIAELRAEVERLTNELRAESELRANFSAAVEHDDREIADLRAQLADEANEVQRLTEMLTVERAQLAELQRINQADYTEAGWQRAREVEAQLAVAQETLTAIAAVNVNEFRQPDNMALKRLPDSPLQ